MFVNTTFVKIIRVFINVCKYNVCKDVSESSSMFVNTTFVKMSQSLHQCL